MRWRIFLGALASLGGEGNQNMNAQAVMQRLSLLGPASSIPNPIRIRIEVFGEVYASSISGSILLRSSGPEMNSILGRRRF